MSACRDPTGADSATTIPRRMGTVVLVEARWGWTDQHAKFVSSWLSDLCHERSRVAPGISGYELSQQGYPQL